MGDLNARVGEPRIRDENGNQYEYRGIKDHTINDHGRTLVNVCNNKKLVVVNHLIYGEKRIDGNLTFKRKDEWISEIDLCIVKKESLCMIKEIEIK